MILSKSDWEEKLKPSSFEFWNLSLCLKNVDQNLCLKVLDIYIDHSHPVNVWA